MKNKPKQDGSGKGKRLNRYIIVDLTIERILAESLNLVSITKHFKLLKLQRKNHVIFLTKVIKQ